MKLRGTAAIAAAVALAACSHAAGPPSAMRWGMPVYPRATSAGVSSANASIALYQTRDRFEDVYAWYEKELPAGTPRAYSEAKGQATFALFDAGAQRTVHIAAQSSGTMIALTLLIERVQKSRATGR